LTGVALLVVLIILRRDRLFLKKNARDVVSKDMRKVLNLPTTDDQFPLDLAKKDYAKTPSAKMMREMNEES
jgi:hypothetical protein